MNKYKFLDCDLHALKIFLIINTFIQQGLIKLGDSKGIYNVTKDIYLKEMLPILIRI